MRQKIGYVIRAFILMIIFSILGLSNYSHAAAEKTLIIVLDELDFNISEEIISNTSSLGLMSIKTAELYKESSKESFFMTIATGRRVKIESNLFKGIERTDAGPINIQGHGNIVKELKRKYPAFSQEINLLGDNLREGGIKTGFIGEGYSSLLIADKNGKIDRGIDSITYDKQWLTENTDEMFKYVDVLVVSYNIENQQDRIKILRDYIEYYSNKYIYVFPQNVNGDIAYRWNKTLVPIIYNNNEDAGLITSKTTRREGLITSLDIKSDIESKYGVVKKGAIGSKITVVEDRDIVEKSKNNLLEFLNLNIIKYVFHGYIIICQIYVIYSYIFMKKKDIHQYRFIMTGAILSILLSLIFGIFKIHRYMVLYCIVIITSSLLISKALHNRKINSFYWICLITNILILIGVFLDSDIVYDSFIGYNNIVAAGRFYGLNNDIMGVLIATSIVTYYKLKEIIGKYLPNYLALLYVPLVILALSGRYGANLGGYITSIVLFLILIYRTAFGPNKDKKGLIFLIGIGIGIFGLNLLIDINSASTSHAGSLVERIKVFGINEFIYIITVKLKQLAIMSIIPPWCIIFIFQILFLSKLYKAEKKFIKYDVKTHIESFEKYCIMFIVSVVAFIINDTGVVAFTYINTYLIAFMLCDNKLETLLDGDG